MSKEIKCTTESLYYIAYNSSENIYHFGKLNKDEYMATGLPDVETFESEDDFHTRLDELTNDENHYEKFYNNSNNQSMPENNPNELIK